MNVKAEGIRKKYSNKILFKEFSLTIHEGDSIVIVGKSGCGKTTLLNLLSLIEKPDDGKVLWRDKEIKKVNTRETSKIIREEIGYLFQNYALIDNATVEENIKIGLKYRKDKKNKQQLVEQALIQVGLEGYQKRKIYSLSGGEQQRVALARTIVKPGWIIFADEPTGNLDEENSKKIMDILFKLNQDGKTIVVVTHDLEHINNFNQKIVL
ncbi:putative ABC transport system ATP-binding protein [Alkalibacterium subtropicum]|uniref:Putative ABC transport system ATP-binding protein n=1 Tax=Alkalibacterium subtropicum TaxID=753702 RepID=A0A1I1KGG2_9LACT|nr:putative bacteriocin export ABC transporter [Alkalibacterium subtropicum]SFC59741.1 putative ABC transport system ATP-binding protein [Alkalibacterium subtropicum]